MTRQTGRCRHCGAVLHHTFVDLGMSPLCESYLAAGQLNEMEPFYPLHVFVCDRCFLVQLQEYVPPESIFSEFAYFSSYADSWVAHARAYLTRPVGRRDCVDTLNNGCASLVRPVGPRFLARKRGSAIAGDRILPTALHGIRAAAGGGAGGA